MAVKHKIQWYGTQIDFTDEEGESVKVSIEQSDTPYNVIFNMQAGNNLIVLEITDHQLGMMMDAFDYVIKNKDNSTDDSDKPKQCFWCDTAITSMYFERDGEHFCNEDHANYYDYGTDEPTDEEIARGGI